MKNGSALTLTQALLSIAHSSDPLVSQTVLKVVHRQSQTLVIKPVRADDPALWDERWFCSYE